MKSARQTGGNMKVRFLTLGFLFFLESVLQGFGQGTDGKDPQALAAILESLSTMGSGATKVVDTMAEGIIQRADGMAGSIRLKTKIPGRLRVEIVYPDQTITNIFNDGFGVSEVDGKRRAFPLWAATHQGIEHLPILSRMTGYGLINLRIVRVGVETVSGRSCLHVLFYSVPGDDTPAEIERLISEFHLYIDRQSHLIIKTLSFQFSPDAIENRSEVETYFDDYRSVQGVLVPFHLIRFVSGQKDSEILVNTIEFNSSISDSEFQFVN
jgi:hypothetical protein